VLVQIVTYNVSHVTYPDSPLETFPPQNKSSTHKNDLLTILIEGPRENIFTPLDSDALYNQIITDENIITPKGLY
jgi:hypothetical protein